jgi:lipopolysaccharide export system protein LptC
LAQMRGDERQRAFRNARSHSGIVRVAKFALPVIALVAVVGAGSIMWLSRVAPGVSVDISGSAVKDGKLIMANPKLDGFTSDERPYSVRAARAIQDLTGTGIIDLERIEARVPMDGGISAHILAPAGTYNSEANTLDVPGAFTVETTDGMRAELQSAAIDLAAGNLSTPDPVRISLGGSVIEADSLQIKDNGKRLLFENRVKLVVQPEALNRSAASRVPEITPDG